MYHIGKVLNVLNPGKNILSADDTVQAVVEMWDKNVLTFLVHSKLAKKIKIEDTVLVDYRPVAEKLPVPKHVIVKILKGKVEKDVWLHYKKYFSDKQKKTVKQPNMTPQYFG